MKMSSTICLSVLTPWVRMTLAICEPTYTGSLMLQYTYRFWKEYLEMVLRSKFESVIQHSLLHRNQTIR